MNITSKINKSLNLDFGKNDDIWLAKQKTLRILVGVLGISLPFLLWFFLFIYSGCISPMQSISHYYFTRVSSIFVLVLSVLAVFLLVYKGKESIDFYLSSTAGIFALCVVLFPTDNISLLSGSICSDVPVTSIPVSPFRTGFHLLSAAIFLSCLAYMSLFVFTKSGKEPAKRSANKKIRNRIYRTCGTIMLISLAVVVAKRFNIIDDVFYDNHQITFWMETVAVFFFGISWLVKAEVVLKG